MRIRTAAGLPDSVHVNEHPLGKFQVKTMTGRADTRSPGRDETSRCCFSTWRTAWTKPQTAQLL